MELAIEKDDFSCDYRAGSLGLVAVFSSCFFFGLGSQMIRLIEELL